MTFAILSFTMFSIVTTEAHVQFFDSHQPVELGLVHWNRNFETAKSISQKTSKPMLVLFQEVPGCGTCVNYGDKVLSHPLIVDAIENEFVPVAVYNNVKGLDEAVLKSFCEPSWNNPVVRIFNSDQTELTERLSGKYEVRHLVETMTAALARAGRPVPRYLALFAEELRVTRRETATFGMSCFWSGEASLGSIPGVLCSEPGFKQGGEIVQIEFDPSILSYEMLLRAVNERRCAERVYTHNDEQSAIAKVLFSGATLRSDLSYRPDREPKYYLSQTDWAYIPMTHLQAARVNAALASGRSPDEYLSPRQRSAFRYIQSHRSVNWKNVVGSNQVAEDWKVVANLTGL